MCRSGELLFGVLTIAVCSGAGVTAPVACAQESPDKNAAASPPAQPDEGGRLPRLVPTMNGQARETGKLKAIKTNSSLQVVDTATGNPVGPALAHEDQWQIECWRFSPDDKWLAVGTRFVDPRKRANRGRVYLWEVATGKRLKEFQEDDNHHTFGRVSDVAFAKNGELFYFSPTPLARAPLDHPRLVGSTWAAGWSRESDKFKVKIGDLTAQVVDKKTGEPVGPELKHLKTGQIECWAFSSDDKWLVTGTGFVDKKELANLGCVYLWSIASGALVERFLDDASGHAMGRVMELAFSSDDREIYYVAERHSSPAK